MRSKYIVKDLLLHVTNLLSPHIPRASREAQLFLMHYLHVDELWLLTNQQSVVEKDLTTLFEMVEQRVKNKPFEYIFNKVSFYSEEFYVDEGALIPRPETELLIDEVLNNIKNKNDVLNFVEVGVGSGIVSIILALHLPNAKFLAIDISQKALNVAKKNIEKFNLANRITLKNSSLLDGVDTKIDYLVSNPPYIANDAELETNLSYEPQNALFGGDVGDEIIKQLLDEVLNRGINYFTCEMGYDQKSKIQNYLQSNYSLEFYKDLSGFDRGFTLRI